MRVLLLLSLLTFTACAAKTYRPPKHFDAWHPGGPTYQPTEMVVAEPMPTELPFGKYFANDRSPQPEGMTDPYWINGYWAWKAPDWDWIEGRWVERPRPGLIWINPRYYRTGGQQYWVTGYWE